MALTDIKIWERKNIKDGLFRNMKVAAATTILKGAFISIDAAGNAINAEATAAFVYAGIAEESYTNAGAITTEEVLAVRYNDIIKLAVTGVTTNASVGAKVFYTDNDALSLTIVAGTGVAGSQVGRVAGLDKDGVVMIDTSKTEF